MTALAKMNDLLRTNEGAAKWILDNYQTNNFAGSLYDWLMRKGSLSEKQIAAAERNYEKSKPQATTAMPNVSFPNILTLMKGAKKEVGDKKGLKFPTIHYKGLKIYYSQRRPSEDISIYRKEEEEGSSVVGFLGLIKSPDGRFEAYQWRNGNIPVKEFDLNILKELEADPQGATAKEGRRLGNCCFCATRLVDPVSVDVGYGPICAENYGLPHGRNR